MNETHTHTHTNILVFKNKKERENKILIRLKGERIGNIRSAKFLGIVFDSRLAFDKQITQMVEKSTKAINLMCYVCRIS